MIAIVLLAVVAAGIACGVSRSGEQSYAGMGVPTENLVDRPAAAAEPLSGTVRVANNGCFHLEASDGTRYFVVWPEGTKQDSAQVIAPGDVRYGRGDSVAGEGWVRDPDEVVRAADGPDGYMDMVMGFCADGEQVAVLRELSR